MMNYYGGGWGLSAHYSIAPIITWVVIIADLILVGIWLWQNISKK